MSREPRQPGRRVVREPTLAERREPVLSAMDEMFAPALSRLTSRQRATILDWQATDRFYEQVQAALRRSTDRTSDLAQRIAELDAAITASPLPEALTVWRGIRSLEQTFGVTRAERVPALQVPFEAFTAGSVFRAVAVQEFLGPRGALLEIDVPAGTPALWVAGAGNPRLRRQGEILLRPRLRVQLAGVRHEGGVPVLSMQVIAP